MSARSEIRALMAQHDLHTKKSLGQHFLVDDHLLETIAKTAAQQATEVVEIGPGLGTLTNALLHTGVDVVGVEFDARLIPLLEQRFANTNARFVHGDALKVRLCEVAKTDRPALAGNLPYNISTPLLIRFIEQRHTIGPATIMIQHEVAERLLAQPGSKTYGSLSVLVQLYADINRVARVSPGCFLPPPRVRSTVLRLDWLSEPRVFVSDPAFFERVVRAAFSQRRKMMRNSLKTAFDKETVARAEETSGIDLKRRAETLSLKELAELSEALYEMDPS